MNDIEEEEEKKTERKHRSPLKWSVTDIPQNPRWPSLLCKLGFGIYGSPIPYTDILYSNRYVLLISQITLMLLLILKRQEKL